ncbi:MAG TPA: MoxR family ATPase [Acidimicrobiales bacterium]
MTRLDPPQLASPVMDVADAGALGRALIGATRHVLAGKVDAASLAVACILGGGHLLVDDVPGVGKTLLAQSLAAAIGGSFRRIQGTPDLLPGDVVGSIVPDDAEGHRLRFRPGPIFANVVVFDEINRTSPRTQAALLEAAEEWTVSIDGHTHPLPAPFLLLATQNPVEMAGTFPLGEGALDRFACTLSIGRADANAERDVLLGRAGRDHLVDVRPVTDPVALAAAQAAVRRVHVADAVADYVVALLHATRQHPGVRLGVSTRGGIALVRLAQAHATLDGRDFVTPADVQVFAVSALAHRTVLEHARGTEPARALVAELVAATPVPRG